MTVIFNDQLIEKWEKAGLLKGIEDKLRVARLLETSWTYISAAGGNNPSKWVTKFMFPLLRRLVVDGLYIETEEQLNDVCKSLDEFMTKEKEWIDKIKYVNALDKEVEILSGFCDHYLVESGHYANHDERIKAEYKRWEEYDNNKDTT